MFSYPLLSTKIVFSSICWIAGLFINLTTTKLTTEFMHSIQKLIETIKHQEFYWTSGLCIVVYNFNSPCIFYSLLKYVTRSVLSISWFSTFLCLSFYIRFQWRRPFSTLSITVSRYRFVHKYCLFVSTTCLQASK